MAGFLFAWVPTVFAMKACLENISWDDKNCDPSVVKKNLILQLE